MTTILSDQGARRAPGARTEGDALWLAEAALPDAVGWTMKPEGLCRGPVCVPIPATGPLRRAGAVDVAGFWRHLGKPVLASDAGDLWLLGEDAGSRAEALTGLEAPDFALPGLDGSMHRLSDHRGSKVLLATWASW